ncbi:transglycosylase SLT domain-containing protein [Stigmatella erecta]|uniref:Transglycosylase SLT domain-containing protein n=1 Tax=Stigmatella erecta TaxID=83460 RepID=A0A1I0KGE3_9BACT|nr:transglycosylase SLT domain-containing protein [Stigmatella erecta]SEU22929.1 Transglycosylase SLT domain-containing protein [Stigmatella erecta]
MAIAPLSSPSQSFRSLQNDTALAPAAVSAPSIQSGGCTAKQGANPMGDLLKDSFGGKGPAIDQLMEGMKELLSAVQQLTELLQSPEIGGGDALGGGLDAAAGAPGVAGGGCGGGSAGGAGGGVGGPADVGGAGGAQAAGGSAPVGEAPQGQVGEWIAEAQKALSAAGIPADKMNAQDIATIIQRESSGNPNAINEWDDNAKNGTPSIGLMQTIQPTFDAHKLPGHDDIRNPVDNIIAAVRYAVDRYGSVSNVPGVQALNNGGSYVGY